MTDGDKIPLVRAVTDDRDKLADGSIRHTRTLHFPGAGEGVQWGQVLNYHFFSSFFLYFKT